jgi:hypothetical protein
MQLHSLVYSYVIAISHHKSNVEQIEKISTENIIAF